MINDLFAVILHFLIEGQLPLTRFRSGFRVFKLGLHHVAKLQVGHTQNIAHE